MNIDESKMLLSSGVRRAVRMRPAPSSAPQVSEFTHDGKRYVVVSRALSADADAPALTPAERDVLRLLVQGLSNAQIARARGRGLPTIAKQVSGLLRKTGCGSRVELALKARRSWPSRSREEA